MKLSDFDYHLPEELIAQYPPEQRAGGRLLDVTTLMQQPEASAADRLLAEVPDVEIRIVEDASHGLPLEQPDTVARLMVRFMREGEDG